jgi:serine/threonine protein phosphatase PrpC
MGDYLSTPNMAKHSNEGSCAQFSFGASSMQGWRSSNEDAHVTAINIEPGISVFAVFDGHGGCEVAKYCENHLIKELKANKDY